MPDININPDVIRELAELLEETGLTEIEVAEGEKHLRVNRGGVVMAQPSGAPGGAPGISQGQDPVTPGQASLEPPKTDPASHPGAVTSPMVGTVYFQPEPGAAPYIQKGSSLNQGDTLVIIEAMKVMNPIKAPQSGTVTQILVENGQPVEYGDVLAVIE